MIMINFDKQRAIELLDCLDGGLSIPVPAGGWTQFEMLQLAGSCYAVAMSQGPPMHPGRDYDSLHPERKEMVSENWSNDLHAAIEFIGLLIDRVHHREFDDQFEPVVKALVTQHGDVEGELKPVSGFKESGQ